MKEKSETEIPIKSIEEALERRKRGDLKAVEYIDKRLRESSGQAFIDLNKQLGEVIGENLLFFDDGLTPPQEISINGLPPGQHWSIPTSPSSDGTGLAQEHK